MLIRRLILATRVTLFVIGYLWMLVIPFPGLGRGTYIDENALQPSQVRRREPCPVLLTFCALRSIPIGTGPMSILQISTLLKWNKYVTLTSRVNSQNIQSPGPPTFLNSFSRRAQFLTTEFLKLGLLSSTQNYEFSASTVVCTTFSYCDKVLPLSLQNINGTNAYAILRSPRNPGTEAMVISASWLSSAKDGDGALNLRGVSTVLALAAFLKREFLCSINDVPFSIFFGCRLLILG